MEEVPPKRRKSIDVVQCVVCQADNSKKTVSTSYLLLTCSLVGSIA